MTMCSGYKITMPRLEKRYVAYLLLRDFLAYIPLWLFLRLKCKKTMVVRISYGFERYSIEVLGCS